MKKANLGMFSMILTVVGGLVSLVGGIVSTLDSRHTAQETAREAVKEYLNNSENSDKSDKVE